jgi:hypothetical protein
LIKEIGDWSKKYVRKFGCELELIDLFAGKLVPKPSIRTFVFKPEAKPILKIEGEKVGRSETERLDGLLMGESPFSPLAMNKTTWA